MFGAFGRTTSHLTRVPEYYSFRSKRPSAWSSVLVICLRFVTEHEKIFMAVVAPKRPTCEQFQTT